MAQAREAPNQAALVAYGESVNRRRLSARLQIAAAPILTGTAGAPYTGFTATASGGAEPRVFSAVLPTGISIHATTGVVSGTPSVAGVYPCDVKVRDDAGRIASQSFTLTVS